MKCKVQQTIENKSSFTLAQFYVMIWLYISTYRVPSSLRSWRFRQIACVGDYYKDSRSFTLPIVSSDLDENESQKPIESLKSNCNTEHEERNRRNKQQIKNGSRQNNPGITCELSKSKKIDKAISFQFIYSLFWAKRLCL